nr:unnamed protein product [Callosobruchus chinensis]
MGERCDSKKCMQSKAKRQCGKITEEQRQELFNKFWLEMDWNHLLPYCSKNNQKEVSSTTFFILPP